MREYLRNDIRAMTGYAPGEQPRTDDFIKLNTNENPYPPSPHVLEAIRQAAKHFARRQLVCWTSIPTAF
ncbi:MAG TPA: hypothetical protein VGP68_15125 [Gemmataceae bacterium]|nr:hypothetical protein [Gemmataceae bacterium]